MWTKSPFFYPDVMILLNLLGIREMFGINPVYQKVLYSAELVHSTVRNLQN